MDHGPSAGRRSASACPNALPEPLLAANRPLAAHPPRMGAPRAVDGRSRVVGAVASGKRLAGRGRDLAGRPAFHGRDLQHAGERRCRARLLLPADAHALRVLRRRYHHSPAALRPRPGRRRGLCGGHRAAAGGHLGGPGGRAGARDAAGGPVPPPGGPAVRPGRSRGRDLHPAPRHRAAGGRCGSALVRVRRHRRADGPVELALADDPRRPSGHPAVVRGPARGVAALDGCRCIRLPLCAATDPLQPGPGRTGRLDSPADLAHDDRPRGAAGHRRTRCPAGRAPLAPAVRGGRGAAAAGRAPARPRRRFLVPAAVPGPVRPLQHARSRC